jgi:DNA polymerase V
MNVSPLTPVELQDQMTLALFLHAMPSHAPGHSAPQNNRSSAQTNAAFDHRQDAFDDESNTFEDAFDGALDETLTLDLGEELIRDPQHCFATYARDDSLDAFGINEGDMLLVDGKLKPEQGDIVVFSVDGELACRQLDMKESCLRSGDPDQQPLMLNDQVGLMVEGVVIHSVRRFR